MSKERVQNQQNLPIRVTDALIFDEAFSLLKDRFEAQMREIEQEMARISNSLENQSPTGSDTTTSNKPFILDFFNNSSLVEGEGENRKLKLQFDVSQFDPSEVTVNIVNNKLMVSASHEEKTDNSITFREYHREFFFPEGVDHETVVSSISKEGVLIVEAPFPVITDKSLAK